MRYATMAGVKICVTGGTGFVGSHTAVALAQRGHELRLLVRSIDRAKSAFYDHDLPLPETVLGDVTDRAAVEAALDEVDAVVHAAAVTALDGPHADEVMRTNVEGTRNVVEHAVERGVARILYVSSASVLGVANGMVSLDAPLPQPLGTYSRSKRDAEIVVRRLQQAGAPIVITYPAGVHGPIAPVLTDGHRSTLLWLRSCVRTSSGTSIVDVRDVAAAHTMLMDLGAPARALLGGHFVAWDQLGALLNGITGRKIPNLPIPGGVLRASGRLGDVVKRVVPFSFPLTTEAMTMATRAVPCDSAPTVAALGLGFRPLTETFADEITWLAQHGYVSAELAGRLATGHRA